MPLDDPRMPSDSFVLQGLFSDLGTGAQTLYFTAPEAGYIKEIHVARSGAGGAGTPDVTLTTALGAVAPVMTMVTGGAAGDVDSLELSKEAANNRVEANEGFSIAHDADFASTPSGAVTVVMGTY